MSTFSPAPALRDPDKKLTETDGLRQSLLGWTVMWKTCGKRYVFDRVDFADRATNIRR
jgi:hypothetical protein